MTAEQRRCKGTLQYTAAGLGLLFFYLLWGDFVLQLMETVIPRIMPLQLRQLGASNKIIGLLITSLPFFFNMTTNPFVSFHSDGLRTSWGRRRPYLIVMTPLVTLALVLLAYAPEIGTYLHGTILRGMGRNTAMIATITVLLSMFQIFHYLMSPMYYYLFVDVVPNAYMSRFMALFRVVLSIKAYLFNTFIFGQALTHTRAIYIGCALIYCVGFLWMCFMVKEGEYPPPQNRAYMSLWAKIRLFVRECYSHPHYLLFNIRNATGVLAGAVGLYSVFVCRDELGLSLDYLGKVGGWSALASAVLYYPMGMLCDRYSPVRVLLVAMVLQLPLALLNYAFLHGSRSFIVLAMLGVPIATLVGAGEMPFFAVLLPREKYGQFGSANQLVTSVIQVLGGFVAGCYMDWATSSGRVVARFRDLYLWTFFWQLVSLVMMVLLYRSWRRYGGPDAYVPPAIEARPIRTFKPEPAIAVPAGTALAATLLGDDPAEILAPQAQTQPLDLE